MVEIGQPIIDLATGEARFRPVELLTRGDSYDIVVAEDLHLDDKRVALKAIRYDNPNDNAELEARRATLDRELSTLSLTSHLLPEPLDWLTVLNPDLDADHPLAQTEPLLVYELQHGKTLREKVTAFGQGIDTRLARSFVHELALLLKELHDHHLIFHHLNPDHIILGLDDILHVVGCANITATGKAIDVHKRNSNSPYIAPEARAGDAAGLIQPHADIYSLGALLVFLLSGVDPLPHPEAPINQEAFQAIGERGPGIARLIARMMAINPKKRFASVDEALPFLHPAKRLEPDHPELADYELPSPWSAEGTPHPSSLSPGPLVSQPRGEASPEKAKDGHDQVPAKILGVSAALMKPILVFSGFALVALVIIILGVFL